MIPVIDKNHTSSSHKQSKIKDFLFYLTILGVYGVVYRDVMLKCKGFLFNSMEF